MKNDDRELLTWSKVAVLKVKEKKRNLKCGMMNLK
jgi:hypothetical protein